MYHVSEIRKINSQKRADVSNSREGTFCSLRDGSVLIRNGARSKTIEKTAAIEFLEQVRGQSTGFIKNLVLSHFQPVTA